MKKILPLGLILFCALNIITAQEHKFFDRIENEKDGLSIVNTLEELYHSNPKEGIKHLNEAIFLADSIGSMDLKISRKIKDSIFNKDKFRQIEELKTKCEIDKKEAEIAMHKHEIETLNQDVKINNLRKGMVVEGMFTFIALSGLLYFGFKQRIKNRIAHELQDAKYKHDIEFKKQELAIQTLHLVQKCTFIQELKVNLENIKQSPELFEKEFRRLVILLKKESTEDKNWEVFHSYFSAVHYDFCNKLKETYSNINEKEIRLSSFLRMNLSTKEIASMLHVLPDSVLKSKYRLKKKLNLDKETDLTSFLNGL